MPNYRTSKGKILDMAALAAKNEKSRAVGNMKVNARGDTIDGEGKIVIPVTEKVADKYSKTVGQRSAQARKPAVQPTNRTPAKPIQPKVELTEEEQDLLDMDQDDLEVEQIKSKEIKK